eukprot:g5332.t1
MATTPKFSETNEELQRDAARSPSPPLTPPPPPQNTVLIQSTEKSPFREEKSKKLEETLNFLDTIKVENNKVQDSTVQLLEKDEKSNKLRIEMKSLISNKEKWENEINVFKELAHKYETELKQNKKTMLKDDNSICERNIVMTEVADAKREMKSEFLERSNILEEEEKTRRILVEKRFEAFEVAQREEEKILRLELYQSMEQQFESRESLRGVFKAHMDTLKAHAAAEEEYVRNLSNKEEQDEIIRKEIDEAIVEKEKETESIILKIKEDAAKHQETSLQDAYKGHLEMTEKRAKVINGEIQGLRESNKKEKKKLEESLIEEKSRLQLIESELIEKCEHFENEVHEISIQAKDDIYSAQHDAKVNLASMIERMEKEKNQALQLQNESHQKLITALQNRVNLVNLQKVSEYSSNNFNNLESKFSNKNFTSKKSRIKQVSSSTYQDIHTPTSPVHAATERKLIFAEHDAEKALLKQQAAEAKRVWNASLQKAFAVHSQQMAQSRVEYNAEIRMLKAKSQDEIRSLQVASSSKMQTIITESNSVTEAYILELEKLKNKESSFECTLAEINDRHRNEMENLQTNLEEKFYQREQVQINLGIESAIQQVKETEQNQLENLQLKFSAEMKMMRDNHTMLQSDENLSFQNQLERHRSMENEKIEAIHATHKMRVERQMVENDRTIENLFNKHSAVLRDYESDAKLKLENAIEQVRSNANLKAERAAILYQEKLLVTREDLAAEHKKNLMEMKQKYEEKQKRLEADHHEDIKRKVKEEKKRLEIDHDNEISQLFLQHSEVLSNHQQQATELLEVALAEAEHDFQGALKQYKMAHEKSDILAKNEHDQVRLEFQQEFIRSHSSEINDMEKSMKVLKEDHEKKIENLKEMYQREISKSEEVNNENMKKMQLWSSDVSEQAIQMHNSMENERDKHTYKLQQLQNMYAKKIEKQEKEILHIKEKHFDSMKSTEAQHSKKLDALQQSYENDVNNLEKTLRHVEDVHAKKLEREERKLQDAVSNLQEKNLQHINTLNEKHLKESDMLHRHFAENVDKIENDYYENLIQQSRDHQRDLEIARKKAEEENKGVLAAFVEQKKIYAIENSKHLNEMKNSSNRVDQCILELPEIVDKDNAYVHRKAALKDAILDFKQNAEFCQKQLVSENTAFQNFMEMSLRNANAHISHLEQTKNAEIANVRFAYIRAGQQEMKELQHLHGKLEDALAFAGKNPNIKFTEELKEKSNLKFWESKNAPNRLRKKEEIDNVKVEKYRKAIEIAERLAGSSKPEFKKIGHTLIEKVTAFNNSITFDAKKTDVSYKKPVNHIRTKYSGFAHTFSLPTDSNFVEEKERIKRGKYSGFAHKFSLPTYDDIAVKTSKGRNNLKLSGTSTFPGDNKTTYHRSLDLGNRLKGGGTGLVEEKRGVGPPIVTNSVKKSGSNAWEDFKDSAVLLFLPPLPQEFQPQRITPRSKNQQSQGRFKNEVKTNRLGGDLTLKTDDSRTSSTQHYNDAMQILAQFEDSPEFDHGDAEALTLLLEDLQNDHYNQKKQSLINAVTNSIPISVLHTELSEARKKHFQAETKHNALKSVLQSKKQENDKLHSKVQTLLKSNERQRRDLQQSHLSVLEKMKSEIDEAKKEKENAQSELKNAKLLMHSNFESQKSKHKVKERQHLETVELQYNRFKSELDKVKEEKEHAENELKLKLDEVKKEKEHAENELKLKLDEVKKEKENTQNELQNELEKVKKEKENTQNELQNELGKVKKEKEHAENELKLKLDKVKKEKEHAENEMQNELDKVKKEKENKQIELQNELEKVKKEKENKQNELQN